MSEKIGHRRAVIDARGQSVRPLDPIFLHLMRRHALIPAPLLKRIAQDVDPKWANRGYWVILTSVASWILVFGGMLAYILWRGRNLFLDPVIAGMLIIQFLLIFGTLAATWYAAKRARFQFILPAMLKHARCPGCGYDLRGLDRASDGATACPECGAAWNLSAAEVTAFEGAPPPDAPKKSMMAVMGLLTLLLLGAVLFSYFGMRGVNVVRVKTPSPAAPASQPAPIGQDSPTSNAAPSQLQAEDE